MKSRRTCRTLRQLPRLARVDVLVRRVGQFHDTSYSLAVLACFEQATDFVSRKRGAVFKLRSRWIVVAELPVEALGDEWRRATRDVHVLADKVAVDPRNEIVWIEIDVLDIRVQLRGD